MELEGYDACHVALSADLPCSGTEIEEAQLATTASSGGRPGASGTWVTPAGHLPIELAAVRTAILDVAASACDLVRSIPDMAAPIPRSKWNVGQAAAHLVVVFRAFTDAIEGRLEYWDERYGVDHLATWARLAAGNERTIGDVADRDDPRALANQLSQGVHSFLAATASRSPDYSFSTPWYGETTTRVLGSMTCLVLGELILHCYDIAAGRGSRWTIDPEQARRIISGVFTSQIPLVVDPEAARGVQAVYQIDVRGGPRFVVSFEEGSASVEPVGSRGVDCHLAGDPVSILLFGYGRVDQWPLIARGKLRAWGRKPWLGPKFRKLLLKP